MQNASRLDAERAKRVEEVRALGTGLREALESLDRRHQSFEEVAGRADAELRDHLLKQSAAFTTDLAATGARLSADLDRIAAGLKSDKLDVAALVKGLTDLAARLGGTEPAGKPARRT